MKCVETENVKQFYFFIPAPPSNVYNGGLLRSLRSVAPAIPIFDEPEPESQFLFRRSLRSVPAYHMYTVPQPQPEDPHQEGLLRSLRSGPNDDIHKQAILRAVRSEHDRDVYEGGLLRSLRSTPPVEMIHGKGLMRSLRSEQKRNYGFRRSSGLHDEAILRAV